MRQIVLDTETTGLYAEQGHRLIEVAGIELVGRRPTGRTLHHYINPDREIDAEATKVHGFTWAMLQDKPRFAQLAEEFLSFVQGAELIIHNAAFDMGFINHELQRLSPPGPRLEDHVAGVIDTLVLARNRYPGQRNSLDHLVKRCEVPPRDRHVHGALLDAEILADVYLVLTGGQVGMSLDGEEESEATSPTMQEQRRPLAVREAALRMVLPSEQEQEEHERYKQGLDKASGGRCLWLLNEHKESAQTS
ncbi:MAG: DNA polymerase III subunit epsilon [Pseudomonadales bacterium]|nr:DNA polymerase III subunit epsilon [Pseudomonadales bacterium]